MEEIDSFMRNGYRSFSSDFINEVKAFFTILLNENALPVAFHCTAGKDRTGMLTALFLLGLDVSKDDVINDYMESNNRIDTENISQEIDEYLRSNSSIQLPYSEQSIQTLVGIIESIIAQDVRDEIFDVVAPLQCTKKEIFSQNAEAFGFEKTEFLSGDEVGKVLAPTKLCELLDYTFLKEDVKAFWQ